MSTTVEEVELEPDAGEEPPSDESLAVAAAAGDQIAFERLFRRYRRVADRSAARAARRLPQLDVEAAASLAMYRLWKSLAAYDARQPFAPWAAVVISRSVGHAAEAAGAQKVRWNWGALLDRETAEGGDSVLERASDVRPGAADVLLMDEEAAAVAALLADVLSDLEATVVRLRLGGWSYREIADRTGRTEKAVDNAARRATKKLRGVAVGPGAAIG